MKDTADRLASKLVRSRGHCERCGSTFLLEAAHIVPRRYEHTRFDPDNLLCLCKRCHVFFTGHPKDFRAYVGPDRWRALWDVAQSMAKPEHICDVVQRLRARLKECA